MNNGIGVLLVILLVISIGYIGFSPSKSNITTTQKTTITTTATNEINSSGITTITITKANWTVTQFNQTIPQKPLNINISVQFTLLQAANVQYTLYNDNHVVGTGIMNENATIPIPITQLGNVTVSTFINSSNNAIENIRIDIYQNNIHIAGGFNGINQRNNVTGFVS